MSNPIHCPECGEFLGDVGLTATGEETCNECGHTFDVADQTMAGNGPDFDPDGVEEPEEGQRVLVYPGDEGEITEVMPEIEAVMVETAIGSDMHEYDEVHPV